MDAGTARLLLDEGLDLLAELPPYEEKDALALGTRLRGQGHDPALVAAVLTQARLRARARGKFGDDAARMLFTADGLEQATRREVAGRHAERFARAGVTRVHDLGCGLGADAIAFARHGIEVHAVDADEATALLAAHNLAVCTTGEGNERGREEAGLCSHDSPAVTHRTAEDAVAHVETTDGVWFDPARRTPGRTDARGRTRRTFRLEDLTPSWDLVVATADRAPATAAKLSPGFPHPAIPAGTEAEWVSTAGDLVECAVWWGPLVGTAGRTATMLRPAADLVGVTEADAVGAPPPGLIGPTPGGLVYEPDLAVLQAGLVGALARAVDGSELAPGVGYVAAERVTDVEFARRHRVVEVLPAQVKAVKAWARREGVTGLTLKRRGGPIDPDDFRRRLGLGTKGGDQATLLLTTGPEGPLALVLDRDD
ncbi:class I SAM-dependent methyltransferase [Mobilicoccus massiliensis]|uniref:class I SAM-dependent methyltransferase n=1 Tax=Mobilicoccus massiliensis TaxID=1522310 RepID=UPI00058ED464|nr:class I SAM-dependent methyltransferase [Mobilicoccus massiliensis]